MSKPQKFPILKYLGLGLIVLGLFTFLFVLGVGAAVSKEATAAGVELPMELWPIAEFFLQGATRLPLAMHISIAVTAILLVAIIFIAIHCAQNALTRYKENAALDALIQEGYNDTDYAANKAKVTVYTPSKQGHVDIGANIVDDDYNPNKKNEVQAPAPVKKVDMFDNYKNQNQNSDENQQGDEADDLSELDMEVINPSHPLSQQQPTAANG